jgi:hypothetical protein
MNSLYLLADKEALFGYDHKCRECNFFLNMKMTGFVTIVWHQNDIVLIVDWLLIDFDWLIDDFEKTRIIEWQASRWRIFLPKIFTEHEFGTGN